jgi:hypothetical protein
VSVDVWFTHDIEQIILAAVHANEEAIAAGMLGSNPLRQRSYHQGFRAALSTLALALGLPQLPPADDREECAVVDSSVGWSGGWTAPDENHARGCGQTLVLSGMGEEVSRGSGSPLVR